MTCSITDCSKAIKSRGWCQMHYFRWRRHGDPMVRLSRLGDSERAMDRGYVKVRLPAGHPLATNPVTRWQYEHRVVLFESYGSGPYSCHWCGTGPLTWATVQADHIDYNRTNNTAENIRPSCLSCNIGRHEGADIEGWARATAARRVLRIHADEFEAHVSALLAELAPAERGTRATDQTRRAQFTRACR